MLSVVVAATDSAQALAGTIASLQSRAEPGSIEILVAAPRNRVAPGEPPPGVRWIAAPAGTGVPRLRRLGMELAAAPVIAFTEDSCILEAGWTAAYLDAFKDPGLQAATGPVEPAMGRSPIDWAVFACEYAPFVAGGTSRATHAPRLAGNNFAVRRGLASLAGTAIHESEVRRELGRGDGSVLAIAGAVARHVRRYTVREAIGDRLRFGFEYGRLRAAQHPRLLNAAALLAGPAILAVQLARVMAHALAGRRFLGPYLSSLPVTVALLSAWSAGESLGWMSGPGRPARRGCGTGGRTPARPAPSVPGCRAGPGTS